MYRTWRIQLRRKCEVVSLLTLPANYAEQGLCICRASVCLSVHSSSVCSPACRSMSPQQQTRCCRHEISTGCCTAHSSAACGGPMRVVPRCQRTLEAEHRLVCTTTVLYFTLLVMTLSLFCLASGSWRRGVVISGVRRMNQVNALRVRLVVEWVTVFGRVYHLGM